MVPGGLKIIFRIIHYFFSQTWGSIFALLLYLLCQTLAIHPRLIMIKISGNELSTSDG